GFTVLDPAIRPGGALRKATRAVPGPHKWSAPSIYREPRYTKWSRISTCHQEATIPPPSRSPRTAQTEELRADARENRERLLTAAREVFAEQGLEAPLAEVARRAGVGIATLFRRFPDREQLVSAAFSEKLSRYADAIDRALADPDPWNGFCRLIERVAAMQAEDRGFTRVLTMRFSSGRIMEAERQRGSRLFRELVEKAKATGKLRPDVEPQDFALVMMGNAGVIRALGDEVPGASRRLVGYLLGAFATDQAPREPLPPAPSETALRRAMKLEQLRVTG